MTNIETVRHSLSHVLAYAVQEMYPGTKFGIGPAIENGFYYDFGFNSPISETDLPKIEKKMRELLKTNFAFESRKIGRTEAEETFKNQPYKLELIQELRDGEITAYQSGKFLDLCAGPHVNSAKEIPADGFKLEKTAGAYWRGSEKNPMLTRIYGAAFNNAKELQEHLQKQKEALEKDHRVLGEKLHFFTFNEKIGKGLPLWLPKGYFIRRLLEDYMYEKEKAAGYLHVLTPILAKEDLYKTSGHLVHYKDEMYSPIEIEGERYYLKPMNCPHHHAIYQSQMRSYRDLPLRIAEFGNVYRFERSGVLTGLIRVRGFTQNDAHIYAAPESLEKEITNILKLFKRVYADFKISDWWLRLSLPDFSNKEKFGDIENKAMWEKGEAVLKQTLKDLKFKYVEAIGEASFYGPKIDIQIKNIFGKEDTIATVQVDYYSASKFDLNYIDQKGQKQPAVIIHRAILGSFDRFFAFLLEKTGGDLPLWLSPEQIWIIPVTEKHAKYARDVAKQLRAENIRVKTRDDKETVGRKIREGELQKIPYLLVVGDKEIKAKAVAVRKRGKKEIEMMKLSKFLGKVKIEIEKKK